MLQINVIQEKAAEAEAIVKSITSDIQRLDIAKRNLTGAIQTIERWGMLRESYTLIDQPGIAHVIDVSRTCASTAEGNVI